MSILFSSDFSSIMAILFSGDFHANAAHELSVIRKESPNKIYNLRYIKFLTGINQFYSTFSE